MILPFEWRGPGACCNLPWKCHGGHIDMELCDECNKKKVSVLYRKSHERVNFCDFTSLCVDIVISQGI